MNKKGFLRVVEATLAVIIILTVMLLIASQKDVKVSEDLTDILHPILDEIAQNDTFRTRIVIDYNTTLPPSYPNNNLILDEIRDFVGSRIKSDSLNYSASICQLNVVCPLNEVYPVESNEDIFSAERVISSTLNEADSPKRLKLFLWRNG